MLVDAVRNDDSLLANAAIFANAHVKRIEHHVRIRQRQATLAKGLHLSIEFCAQYADLRFRHLRNAKFVQHFLDFTRTHTRDEHLLNSRDQRALAALAMFNQRWNEIAFACPRNAQVDASHARID